MDTQGFIQYANPAVHTIFDWDSVELTGISVSCLQPGDIAAEFDLVHAIASMKDETTKKNWET